MLTNHGHQQQTEGRNQTRLKELQNMKTAPKGTLQTCRWKTHCYCFSRTVGVDLKTFKRKILLHRLLRMIIRVSIHPRQ